MKKESRKELNNCSMILNYDNNFLNAYLTVKGQEFNVTEEDIKSFLSENKVIYGIEHRNINELITFKTLDQAINIAIGQPPVAGEDGYVKNHFEANPKIQLKQDEGGKIDFKELEYVKNINENEVLAEKIPPTEGINGIDVFGEEIKALSGKEAIFKMGKNVHVSKDGKYLLSSTEGKVEIKDNKIQVSTILEIKGNVDASTGNIRFKGDISVFGDVKSGYSIESAGNVQINGVVENASIKCKGNLIVKNGIQGNEKEIVFCEGDLVCKYIENARVICERNVICDFIIHSSIICAGNVQAKGKKGLIAGGELRVKNEVICEFLGAPMGTKTAVEVGLDPKLKLMLRETLNKRDELEKKAKNTAININFYKDLLKKGIISESAKQKLFNFLNDYNSMNEQIEVFNVKLKKIDEEIKNVTMGKISVGKTIYGGVKITMGIHIKYIREEMNSCKIYLEGGTIVFR